MSVIIVAAAAVQVRLPDSEVRIMRAESEDEMKKWMSVLSKAALVKVSSKPGAGAGAGAGAGDKALSAAATPVPAGDDSGALMRGACAVAWDGCAPVVIVGAHPSLSVRTHCRCAPVVVALAHCIANTRNRTPARLRIAGVPCGRRRVIARAWLYMCVCVWLRAVVYVCDV
jgi:hypothetical protein